MSDQHMMNPNGGFAHGQPVANGMMSDRKTSPPAFLDLADSAARFNQDINARVEQKRLEHERQRSAQRRVFEDQMRMLEQQQIAEERALLSTNTSPTGMGATLGGDQLGHGVDGQHHLMPSFNVNMGVALSAPTTPPLGDHLKLQGQQGLGMYDGVGIGQAIRAAVNAGFAGNGQGVASSNGLATPTTNSGGSNPFDGLAGNASSNFSTVVGTPTSAQSPTKRKSVGITPSPEVIQGSGGGANNGSVHALHHMNLGHFSSGMAPTNSSSGMGMGGGTAGFGSGAMNGMNGGTGAAYGHGARSMPASRRGSAGSKDGGVGDDLVQGLRGLGIGGGDNNVPAEERHRSASGGRLPGSIVTTGNGGRPVQGPYTSTSTFGHPAFLFDAGLDDEMQNSVNHLPMTNEDDRFTNLRTSASINFNIPSNADSYPRKMSVSSAALDLAQPMAQTPPRSAFLASRANVSQHQGNSGSSEWPQFNSRNPQRPSSGGRASIASPGSGNLPSGGLNGMSGNGAGLGQGYRNGGGVMTVGNATPIASGAATPSYPLKAAANVRESGAGSMTPNGLASLSQHISNATGATNYGPGMGQSPESRAGGSPGTRFLPSDGASSTGSAGAPGGGLGAGFMGGARSVPATPLSGLPGSNLAATSLLKTQPIGPLSPAHGQDMVPNYASDLVTSGGGGTPYTPGGQQRGGNVAGTPAGMYEPVTYGSIAGDPGVMGISDDNVYGNNHSSANSPSMMQNQYGMADDLSGGANYAGSSIYQTVGPNGMNYGASGAGLNNGARAGPNVFVPGAPQYKPTNGNGHNPNRSVSSPLYNQQAGRFPYGNQAAAPALGRMGSNAGFGDSKMGGLHGPKHKRSDIDREYNRFTGTRLEDLVGEISQLCKDQHGCRYLQKKLEENNPEYRDIIFRETFPHFAQLMTDPFGNYLCQKLLEFSTDEQRSSICQSVAQDLVQISLNMHGTRAVQKMIDFLSNSRQTDPRYDSQIHSIILALSMHVVTLIKDLNGNHVVQKCLNKLSAEDNQFIYNAVAQHCVEVATHRHGCCVLQRCVDHASESQKVQLVTEITYHALTLVQDPYGNYVVQYILDLNDNRFSDAVIRQFFGNVCALSVQKFSSNVIEKCIRVAEHGTRKLLVDEFLHRNRLEKLLRDSYGNYCVQTALDYADPDQRRVLVEGIRPILPLIRNTPYGKRIQSKLQREQMEAAHAGHFGAVQGYRAGNHPGLMNAAMANNGHHAYGRGGQPRHASQPSIHHTGGVMDPYTQQTMYSHGMPPNYNGHAMATGYPPHTMLHRQGSGSSLMNDATYAGVPPYSTPLTTGYSLPPGDPYLANYGYGA